MVLVDSTAPASAPESAAEPRPTAPRDKGSYDLSGRVSALISTSARFGLGRLIGQPTAGALRSTIDEYAEGSSSAKQAASLRDFADKPLVVLTAGVGGASDKLAKHDALARLSTNSLHRVIQGADHPGMIVDEKGAAATTRAILDVVSSVQTSQPLPR